MAYDWPTALPRSPLSGTLGRALQPNEVRSQADVGEGQVRKLATATSQIISFQMMMDQSQLDALDAFFDIVGTWRRFNFLDPVKNETKEFRFNEPYNVTDATAGIYKIDITLIRKAE